MKCTNLRHVGHTAHVPLTDVLGEGNRNREHAPERRHAADGGREGGHTVRSWHTAGVCGRVREWIAWRWPREEEIGVVW